MKKTMQLPSLFQQLCLISLLLNFCAFSGPEFAAAEGAGLLPEEEELMHLYFSEEDLVESSSRYPKSILEVAENVTIITAKEIQAMNAHSLDDVLNRIPGVFVSSGRQFGGAGTIYIQGSESRHLLALVDGVTLNFLSGGNVPQQPIPLGIIERIEVIKGPASSTWGSSLGGVINIITKKTGKSGKPAGSATLSYGEQNTLDDQAEVYGSLGQAGYYLYAGKQQSGVQGKLWDIDGSSFYGKLDFDASSQVKFGLNGGFNERNRNLGELPVAGILSEDVYRNARGSLFLDYVPDSTLSLNLTLYAFKQKYDQMNDELGLFSSFGIGYARGDLFQNNSFDENTVGSSGRLSWTPGSHVLIAGFDVSRGKLDQSVEAGAWRLFQGAQPFSTYLSAISKWAFYLNDTYSWGKLTVTPGIRFDDNSVTDYFLSPSLGLTYRLSAQTLLRGSVSRGFNIPPLSYLAGGGLFFDPNPALKQEEVLSYQAGFETIAARLFWLKGSFFRHELRSALDDTVINPLTANSMTENRGDVNRQGGELELETASFHDLKMGAGFGYVQVDRSAAVREQEIYAVDLGLKYDDGQWRGDLSGRYYWPDYAAGHGRNYADFIWNLSLARQFVLQGNTGLEVFFTAHNLFDGVHVESLDFLDTHRWIEGGCRLIF